MNNKLLKELSSTKGIVYLDKNNKMEKYFSIFLENKLKEGTLFSIQTKPEYKIIFNNKEISIEEFRSLLEKLVDIENVNNIVIDGTNDK